MYKTINKKNRALPVQSKHIKATALSDSVQTLLMLVFFLLSLPAYAQLIGEDTTLGAPCSAKGSVRMTANASGSGAYILTCDGDSGQWVATINVTLPTANAQAANKEYVDNAIESSIPGCTDNTEELCLLSLNRALSDPDFIAGNIADGINILGVTGTLSGNGCALIGDTCPDGTVFIGHHPFLLVPVYITPMNLGSAVWTTAPGTKDIAVVSDSDGRINSDQIPNSDIFPAFKICKDLRLGGYSDWYLPSRIELIMAVGVTPLSGTWLISSTESSETERWSSLGFTSRPVSKSLSYSVICMRR